MTQLAFATDLVQVPTDGTGKKTAFFLAAVSGGSLYIPVSIPSDETGNLLVDSSGTFVTGKVASGATDAGNPVKVGGRYNSTLPTLTNGQRGDLQLDASARLRVDGSGVTQPVSGTVTANAGTGPFPVSDNAGTLTVDAPVGTPVAARLSDGAAFLTTTGGRLSVDASGVAVPITDNSGTLTVDQATAANLNAQVVGPTAADTALTANPVTVGGRSSDAVPTAVTADGEVVNLWVTRRGAAVVAPAAHLALDGAPYVLTSKTVQTTTTQTGSDVWTPAGGKKLVIVYYQIQAGGTVAGTVQVWFGANADTTYTRGTDLAIFDGEFAPSTTSKPGAIQTGLWIASAVDHEVHLTTSAAINPLTVTLWGYEI